MKHRYRNVIVLSFVCLSFFLLGMFFQSQSVNPITRSIVEGAEKLIGLTFADAKHDSMLDGLKDQLGNYENIRKVHLPNNIPPAILFNPIPVGMEFETDRKQFKASSPGKVSMPSDLDDLAFYSVGQLAELLRTRKVTSEQLTRMYLTRLKQYGSTLECVITLTEDLALAQARRADDEIAAGRYRGPLHGIPYGAKDLLAVTAYRTTWGATPYKDQVLNENATVIKRLEDAGAVLVAKLTMGELAWGDV